MRVIAIVGTRDYSAALCYALFNGLGGWLQAIQRDAARQRPTPAMPPFMIVSGDGGNVDLAVRRMCLETYRLPFTAFPADWNGPLQKGAGLARNGYIAKIAHCGIALHDGQSTGTLDTITKIQRRGMPTLITHPDRDFKHAATEIRTFLREVFGWE